VEAHPEAMEAHNRAKEAYSSAVEDLQTSVADSHHFDEDTDPQILKSRIESTILVHVSGGQDKLINLKSFIYNYISCGVKNASFFYKL
jgi:hypothetical protein